MSFSRKVDYRAILVNPLQKVVNLFLNSVWRKGGAQKLPYKNLLGLDFFALSLLRWLV